MTAGADILETKETLDGTRQTFRCRALARRPGEVVVLFLLPEARSVHGHLLPAGTVTFGYFWADRPYNVYHWMTRTGATIAFYVNLVEDTRIEDDTLFFRDLTVDVLLPGDPRLRPRVLDENELPVTLDAATRARIEDARAMVLEQAPALREELEHRSRLLWPEAFPAERRP
jgi:uncharacterized protein